MIKASTLRDKCYNHRWTHKQSSAPPRKTIQNNSRILCTRLDWVGGAQRFETNKSVAPHPK